MCWPAQAGDGEQGAVRESGGRQSARPALLVDRGARVAHQRRQLLSDSQEDPAHSTHQHRRRRLLRDEGESTRTRRRPIQSNAHVAIHGVHCGQRATARFAAARTAAQGLLSRRVLRSVRGVRQHAALRLVRPHVRRLLALRRKVSHANEKLFPSAFSPLLLFRLMPSRCLYITN